MGLLKRKGKESKADGEGAEKKSEASIPPAPSATELALIAERENTSSAYHRAQKAEKAYKTRRQATRARGEYAAAKTHLKTSFNELKSGTKATWLTIWLSPYILREKLGGDKGQKEKKKLARTQSKREKLEAKMKKVEEEVEKRKKEAPVEEDAAAA